MRLGELVETVYFHEGMFERSGYMQNNGVYVICGSSESLKSHFQEPLVWLPAKNQSPPSDFPLLQPRLSSLSFQ